MSILKPNEYRLKNNDVYLENYIKYLEAELRKIKETLENAKEITLSESFIKEIEVQLNEIMNMLEMIKTYKGKIILKSIEDLSLEELQSYFSAEFEKKLENERQKELEKINERKASLREQQEIERKMDENLYLNGRKASFYKAEDTIQFFNPRINHRDYIDNLLSNEIPKTLKRKFIQAIELEYQAQGLELTVSSDTMDKAGEKFIKLIKNCKQILKYSPDAKEELISKILSDKGLGEILKEISLENSITGFMDSIINVRLVNLEFFEGLPDVLKEKLKSERFKGTTYESLKSTYNKITNNEELENEDLNQEERKRLADIQNKLNQLDTQIEDIKKKIDSIQNFMKSKTDMQEKLKQKIIELLGESYTSIEKIDEITRIDDEKEQLKSDLLRVYELIETKKSLLQKATSIIKDPKYLPFFKAVEKQNTRMLYSAMELNVTEKTVEPYIEQEQRRLNQIQILIDCMEKVEEIADAYEEKENAFFLTKLLPSFKRELEELKSQYCQILSKCFDTLKDEDLINVYAPTNNSSESLQPAQNYTSFKSIRNATQTLPNLQIGIGPKTQKVFLQEESDYKSWNEYAAHLMERQETLIKNLFDFSIDEKDFYHFNITDIERKELLNLQRRIIAMYTLTFEERKKFREDLESGEIILDEEISKELKEILGEKNILSRENLAVYISVTTEEINRLESYLYKHATLCQKLGIALSTNGGLVEETPNFDQEIMNLGIEGVTTLDEALAYRDLIQELYNYKETPEQIRSFYLSRTI